MVSTIAMFESPAQWAIVLLIVLVFFGGGRISDVMRGLGSGMREFKRGLNEDQDDKKDDSGAS